MPRYFFTSKSLTLYLTSSKDGRLELVLQDFVKDAYTIRD